MLKQIWKTKNYTTYPWTQGERAPLTESTREYWCVCDLFSRPKSRNVHKGPKREHRFLIMSIFMFNKWNLNWTHRYSTSTRERQGRKNIENEFGEKTIWRQVKDRKFFGQLKLPVPARIHLSRSQYAKWKKNIPVKVEKMNLETKNNLKANFDRPCQTEKNIWRLKPPVSARNHRYLS